MVTQAGVIELNKLFCGDTADEFLYIAYGTGTTAEAKTQTALVTETARVSAKTQIESSSAGHDTMVFFAMAYPRVAGTVAEIGVFNAATAGDMLVRKKLSTAVTYTAGQRLYLVVYVTVKDNNWET